MRSLYRVYGAGLLLGLAGFLPLISAQENIPARPPVSPTKVSKTDMSYSVGLDIGMNVLGSEVELDLESVVKGVRDALSKTKPGLTDEQIGKALDQFHQIAQTKAAERAKILADKSKKEGVAFLADNLKTNKELSVTKSGLQIQVLKQGAGKSPGKTDTVKVHYTGTFVDGRIFDSSVQRKEPAEFPVNRVIPGWSEALQKMKVGDKWKIFIPSELAYGEDGSPPVIPPNSVLVFEVELLEIVN
jgi:FKBP-type peptidyl-prolyl cis-trans isomerase FklB